MDTAAGDERIDEGTYALLELRAAASLEDSPAVPRRLGGAPPIVPPAGATVRHFTLQGHDAINGQGMDLTRIDEVVPANAVEIWEVENNVYSHNFHIHGVSFTILDRDGAPPHAWETGRKDTVHVPEKSTVRLAVQFSRFVDPALPYMYHCHILRHEDEGMMGQFLVVEPGTEAEHARARSRRRAAATPVTRPEPATSCPPWRARWWRARPRRPPAGPRPGRPSSSASCPPSASPAASACG